MNPEPETGQPEEKATEVTEETIQVQAQVEQPVQTAPSARKASADSVCMDTSQASSASSPSSEVSIKSIVSLKAQQPAEVLKGSYGQEATSITVGAVAMADVAGVQTGADETLKRKGSERACSLVSETARKLEAAAAQSQANSMSRPVAAARKTHLDRRPQVARKEPSQDRDEKENVKPVSVPLAKKTICWPPPKPSDDDHRHHDEDRDCKSKKGDLNKPCGSNEDTKSSKSADEPSLPMLGRVTANRLSFQRLIEAEQNKINPPPAANRPKPPPPVKPAGLVARQRFRD